MIVLCNPEYSRKTGWDTFPPQGLQYGHHTTRPLPFQRPRYADDGFLAGVQDSGADYVDASYRYGKTDTVSISHDKGVIVGFAKECVGWLIGMRMKGTTWKHGQYRIPSSSRISSVRICKIFHLSHPCREGRFTQEGCWFRDGLPLFCSLSLASLVFRYSTNRGGFRATEGGCQ